MRQFHPVSLHEKFVASGVYIHHKDDALDGLQEYWTIHELPDGTQLIRNNSDGRESKAFRQNSLLVEALRDPSDSLRPISRMDVRLYATGQSKLVQASATYTLDANLAQVVRRVNNEATVYEEETISFDFVLLDPLTKLFTGLVIHHATTVGRMPQVICPDYAFEAETYESALSAKLPPFPQLEQQTIEEIGVGKRIYVTRQFRYSFFGPSSVNWVDDNGILVRQEFESEGTKYTTLLSQYAHRAEPTKS